VRLAADAESKHLLTGFSSLKKDKYLPDDQCVPDYIVMHVIQLYMKSDGKGTHTPCAGQAPFCVSALIVLIYRVKVGEWRFCSGTRKQA
jgi:hypothetical protein